MSLRGNEEFIEELFYYFINNLSTYSHNNIIKKHTESLYENGDYSFPINIQNWTQFLTPPYSHNGTIFSYRELKGGFIFQSINEHIQNLIESSRNWKLQVQTAKIKGNRCLIFLNRHAIFYSTIKAVLSIPDYTHQHGTTCTIEIVKSNVVHEEEELLTKYRCRIVRNVIENLMKYSKIGSKTQCLYVTHKSTDFDAPTGCAQILVGNVTCNDSIVLDITAKEYIKKRSLDMQLMAQHKYGLRVQNEEYFQTLIGNLGKAAVTIDLLEVKPSCPVKVMAGCATGRSKGASFILYNSARLETLMKKYNQGVATGIYPETPLFDVVNLTLLKEEEEWSLLFNYIFAYHSLINQTIGDFHKPKFSLHLLCTFLNGLASTFSIYYGRIRILTENRPQLIPTLHARIYLLKCLRIVFNDCLDIFNIKPLQKM